MLQKEIPTWLAVAIIVVVLSIVFVTFILLSNRPKVVDVKVSPATSSQAQPSPFTAPPVTTSQPTNQPTQPRTGYEPPTEKAAPPQGF